MNDFKAGELVKLVSGGPVMTVTRTSPRPGEVVCQWFAGKKLESGSFAQSSLAAADPDEATK